MTTRIDDHDARSDHGTRPDPLSTLAPSVVERVSTRFGIAFVLAQLATLVLMGAVVLPSGGAMDDPAVERGQAVLAAADLYRAGNYVFMLSGVLLLGFLGAIHARMRRVDASGVLGTIAVAAGTLLVVIWPLAAVLHDVSLETARLGTDPRILAGWDAVAPYSLAFSALPRLFLMGCLVIALRAAGRNPWLVRVGIVIMAISLVGSATTVFGALFPVLALGSLAFEVWLGVVAWRWLRELRGPRGQRQQATATAA
ncbi:hypothetical protein [Agromyces bauzanensis]